MNPTMRVTEGKIGTIIILLLPDPQGCDDKFCQIKYIYQLEVLDPVAHMGVISVKEYIFILQCKNYKELVNY